jgi:hypothetical protein
MFTDTGIEADHIAGEENVVADFLSRLRNANDLSAVSFKTFQTRFPCLKGSRRFLPSRELLSLLYTTLSTPSVEIPTTRVKLGRMTTVHDTSSVRSSPK